MSDCQELHSVSMLFGLPGDRPETGVGGPAHTGRGLPDSAILQSAKLHSELPAGIYDPDAPRLTRRLANATRVIGFHFRVVTWPDGVWAYLGYNADWEEPRPVQLLRAYRNARAAGCRFTSSGAI